MQSWPAVPTTLVSYMPSTLAKRFLLTLFAFAATCPASKCSWVNERFLSFCGGGFCCCRYCLVGINAKAELFGLLSELGDSVHCRSIACWQDLQSRHCGSYTPLFKAPPAALLATCAFGCTCAKPVRRHFLMVLMTVVPPRCRWGKCLSGPCATSATRLFLLKVVQRYCLRREQLFCAGLRRLTDRRERSEYVLLGRAWSRLCARSQGKWVAASLRFRKEVYVRYVRYVCCQWAEG